MSFRDVCCDSYRHHSCLKKQDVGWNIAMRSIFSRYSLLAIALMFAATGPVARDAVAGTVQGGGAAPTRKLNRDVFDISDRLPASPQQAARMWDALVAGHYVRIVGPCQSRCKLLLKHMPRNNICAAPEASLGFHAGDRRVDDEFMNDGYPPDIQNWVRDRDEKAAGPKWLRPPELYYYFRTCESVAWEAGDWDR